MILEEVLCSVRDRLMESGYFNVFYEYCERVQKGKIIEPQYYQKGGQYKPVMDFDVNGTGYIRKNGKTQMRFNTSFPQITGCDSDSVIDLTTPGIKNCNSSISFSTGFESFILSKSFLLKYLKTNGRNLFFSILSLNTY